jgi:gluconolactonase
VQPYPRSTKQNSKGTTTVESKELAAERSTKVGRRPFIAGVAGTIAAAAASTLGQGQRDYDQKASPVRYPDADILVLDKRFGKYKIGNAAIERLYVGCRWAEGPAWNGVGRYLVWSDIPNDRQLRWIADDNRVSVFRQPANNSNGNTFDWEGRQLSCEHATRRVVRYEHNGTVTVLADKWQGKPFNAPNDIVVHPDGGVWFTDPGYGSMGDYEGNKGDLLLKEAVYRVDPKTAKLDLVTDSADKPNGLCFSVDYKKLYIADTGEPGNITIWDVADGKIKNKREFAVLKQKMKDGSYSGGADGIRVDVDGNLWAGCGWVGAGYDGVQVFAPDGQKIGQILLPEICANIAFGGPKRNRLFMASSQSLYSLYVGTRGAHIC